MPRTTASVAAAIAAMLLVTGCGDDEVVQVQQDQAIQVVVQTAPESLDTGGRTSIQVIVQRAPAGADLRYGWLADAGTFADATTDSTTWTAPDNPGVYGLSVVVTDGDNVAIAQKNVAVATYMPADDPFYKGATSCSVCHNGGSGGTQWSTWSVSAHANAIESLQEIGMDDNPTCLKCHTVGSYGLNADVALDNGGYDETAVPRLAGVQCENCHGPGSQHPSPNFTSVDVTMDASLCGQCHTDAHHPTYDEWQTSAHAAGATWTSSSPPGLRASCSKCHNGMVSAAYLDDPQTFVPPTVNPTQLVRHTCAVCHDAHGNTNPGSLRDASVTDVWLPNNVLVEEAGAGRLCISCHNGRRTETDVLAQINNGTSNFGPHHSIQGDALKGVNAYQTLAPGFPWSSSKHILVEDACVACHTHQHEGDPEAGIPNFMGHDFLPVTEACARCHGPITDFEDIVAKADFDGNGSIEGVQVEVRGLLDLLQQTIIDKSRNDSVRMDFINNFIPTLGDTTKSTRVQREAGYNWAYVDYDGSSGVHNTTYSVQLLQQSILYLEPSALPQAAFVLREDM